MPVSSRRVPEILVKQLGVLCGQNSCLFPLMQYLEVVKFAVSRQKRQCAIVGCLASLTINLSWHKVMAASILYHSEPKDDFVRAIGVSLQK